MWCSTSKEFWISARSTAGCNSDRPISCYTRKMELKERNLLLVCGTLEAGGAERILSVLSGYFIDYFRKVVLVTWREAPVFYPIDERIELVSVPVKSGSRQLIMQMKWFRKYVGESKPCVVLSFLAPFNILTVMSLVGSSVPVFVAGRSDPRFDAPNRVWRLIRDITYSRADRICVQTEDNRLYFRRRLRKKTEVIYNPVFLEPDQIGQALRTPKTKTIVSVGRLTKAKNQLLLLHAFAGIVRAHPEYRLVIYGEGEMRPALEREIEKSGLWGKVFLPGVRQDVLQMITEAELFVLSSDYEGMPNALMEAMCLGLPCISTRVSGATELICDRINGRLVERNDPDALQRAMEELIEDKAGARNMACQAIQLAEQLKPETIVTRWIDFFINGLKK